MNYVFNGSFDISALKYSLAVIIILASIYFLFRDKFFSKKGKFRNDQIPQLDPINESNEDYDFSPSLEDCEHIPFCGITKTFPGGADEFYEIVNDRRSIRSFSDKPIPFEIIEACVKAAGTAPSGAHTEPWTFCVVADNSIKREIREIVENEEYVNYQQRMHRQWVADLKPLRTNHVKEYLTTAPYLILIFKQTYGLTSNGQRKQHYYNEISVSIATGILLCALQAAGLNSLVTTPMNCGSAIRDLLQRPKNEKLVVLLPVGYSSENCEVPNLQRKPLNEILVKY